MARSSATVAGIVGTPEDSTFTPRRIAAVKRRRRHSDGIHPVGSAPARRASVSSALPVMVGLALLVKLLALFQLGDHPLLQPLGDLDGAHYIDVARQVAAQGPLAVGEVSYVSPLYVYFLAGVFRLGGDLGAARFLQVLLGAAGVGCIHLTARRWYGERAATAASLLAIFTGIFSFYEVLILQAALDPFLVSCALCLVSRAVCGGSSRVAAAAGLALGTFALNRPNALPYAVVVVAGLLFVRMHHDGSPDREEAPAGAAPREWRRRIAPALACAGALALVLVGNAVRNLAASGEFVVLASHGGLNFYIGNHAGADGTYQLVPGITPSIIGQARDAAREAEAETGRALTASEVSGVFYRRALRWMADEPVAAARLFARKLTLVIHRVDVPLNYSYAYYSRDEATVLRWLVVGAWLLVPLGMAGLAFAGRHARRGFWVWASFVPVYSVAVAAFFVSSRYRMPLLVPLCVASGGAVAMMADRLRSHAPWKTFAPPIVVGLVAAAVTWWPLHVDDGRGGEQTRKAVWMVEQGRVDEALAYVALVEATHRHAGVLHFRVAEALATASLFDPAIAQYGRAMAIDGPRPAIVLPLGQALVVAGRPRDAVTPLSAAYDANYQREVAATWLARALALAGERDRAVAFLDALPDAMAGGRPGTAEELGAIALQIDAPDRAVRWYRLAVAHAPGRAEAHDRLGAALLMIDEPGDAVAPLETACRLEPSSTTARVNLALALARIGRLDDALIHAREAARLAPADPRVSELVGMLTRARPR